MPRKRKAKAADFPAQEPTSIGDAAAAVMDRLKEQGVELTTGDKVLKPLSPPEPELQPLKQLTDAREAKALIDTPSEPKPEKGPGDTEIAPSPERNGKHAEKAPKKRDAKNTEKPRFFKDGSVEVRDASTGRFKGTFAPRQRDVEEPRAVYTGPNIRLTLDGGDTFNIESRKPLSREQTDKVVAAGFDQVDDEGRHFQASKSAIQSSGKDVNILAIILDGKGERIGRSR